MIDDKRSQTGSEYYVTKHIYQSNNNLTGLSETHLSQQEERSPMRSARWLLLLVMLMATLGLMSCGAGAEKGGGGGLAKLQGAGASFPAPLYTKWFKTYSSSHNDVQIDYQSVGSGGG